MLRNFMIGAVLMLDMTAGSCDEPLGPASSQTRTTAAPGCEAQLVVRLTDPKPGTDHRMGALLVVRNEGSSACSVPGLPKIDFMDAAGHSLGLYRGVPIGMHPGPVVVPVGLAPGAVASASISWDAERDKAHCATPALVAITFESTTVRQAFVAPLCGLSPDTIKFSQTPLRIDG